MTSLPASQRRALDTIEGTLRAADPHLASMFAIFARLNVGEPVPTEPLTYRPKLGRQRPHTTACAVVLIPVIFIALIVVGVLAGGPSSATACGSDHPKTTSPLVDRPACRLAADTTAVKAASATTADGAENPTCLAIAPASRSARRAGGEAAPAGQRDTHGWVCYK
jgi:hypothetical protein